MKFTELQLEKAFIKTIEHENISHVLGQNINRNNDEVLIKQDLKDFLLYQYKSDNLTDSEADYIISMLEKYPSSDLYKSNKIIMKMISDGFPFKREDRSKDIWIYLIDFQ